MHDLDRFCILNELGADQNTSFNLVIAALNLYQIQCFWYLCNGEESYFNVMSLNLDRVLYCIGEILDLKDDTQIICSPDKTCCFESLFMFDPK